jgi:energy-coupling factor transport system permease protein
VTPYRRLASPLHAARASVAGAFCLALAAAVLSTRHPLVLLALLVALVLAAAGVHAGPALRRAARLGVPLALLVALINPLVVRDGLTVFAQLGEIPALGQVDLTVEALVYGAIDGVRVLLVLLACALFSTAVDPDELLRGLRRHSMRSALTVVLALRLVPVLARDARRLEQARRCRPDGGGGHGPLARAAVLRAVTTGALDRALDVAATLEVRGYAAQVPTAAPRERAPRSRHDLAFAAAGLVLLACAVASGALGVARFDAYPSITADTGPGPAALAVAIVLAAALPFLDRRGIAR